MILSTVGFCLFKHPVHHIDGLDFLAVNDFRIYLRGAHIGVSHQFAGGVKVCPHGHHHRSEGMAARVGIEKQHEQWKREENKTQSIGN